MEKNDPGDEDMTKDKKLLFDRAEGSDLEVCRPNKGRSKGERNAQKGIWP